MGLAVLKKILYHRNLLIFNTNYKDTLKFENALLMDVQVGININAKDLQILFWDSQRLAGIKRRPVGRPSVSCARPLISCWLNLSSLDLKELTTLESSGL
jgi:hypothetical protein